jgi:hypothetical protein
MKECALELRIRKKKLKNKKQNSVVMMTIGTLIVVEVDPSGPFSD